jgi:hypothetical protein
LAVADGLGDMVLRSDALGAVEVVLHEKGEFLEALEVADRRNALLPDVADPDRVADALFIHADLSVSLGRLAESRAMTERMEETVSGLTPHHRVHGLGMRMILEGAVADWEAIRQLTPRAEQAVEENLATPCPFNVGLLTRLATAWIYAGNAAEAVRLLARADEIGMASYVVIHTPAWLGLALAREDGAEIRRLIDSIQPSMLAPSNWALWAELLDGLLVLDDRERIETEAPRWLKQNLYVTPFAMRALAFVRKDAVLLEEATATFESIGLTRHAQRTRVLMARGQWEAERPLNA